jgi:hypothetical protein
MPQSFEDYTHNALNDPDDELFSVDTVDRFSQAAEEEFANEFPCIQHRVALSIVSGTSTYELSDNVLSIRRITWKGKKLDPLPHRNFRESFQSATQSGTPFWYVYNNIGLNQIKFFPAPNETISSITTNLYGSEIASRVIVDYFRTPDFSSYTIPAYFRRRLLRAGTVSSCFAIEGEGQNLKASKYFKSRWQFLKQQYSLLLGELHNKPRKLVLGSCGTQGFFPGSPMLPMSRYGISLDAGE